MTTEEVTKRLSVLEEKVRVFESLEEIKQLQYRYINAVSLTKWDDVIDCFAEDSTTDFSGWDVIKGKPVIYKQFTEGLSAGHVGREGNLVIHPIISVDGDKATGNWWMFQMWKHKRTGQSLWWVQAIYDGEYVRENGRWKIKYLKWRARNPPPGGPPPFEGT